LPVAPHFAFSLRSIYG